MKAKLPVQERSTRQPGAAGTQARDAKPAAGFVDHRPSAQFQRNLAAWANSSPQATQLQDRAELFNRTGPSMQMRGSGPPAIPNQAATAEKRGPEPAQLSSDDTVMQGKWFRMSSILTDEDEQEIEDIRKSMYPGDYWGALKKLLAPYPSLQEDAKKIFFSAQKYNIVEQLGETLGRTFYADGKAYTAAEIIEVLEGEILEHELKSADEFDSKVKPNQDSDLIDEDTNESHQSQESQDKESEEENLIEAYSPQERGLMAVEEIQGLIQSGKVKDELQLGSHFSRLYNKYGMTAIALNRESNPVSVRFKINPEFEVKLNGSNAVEMRSAGSGSGANQTKVQWVPQPLKLSTSSQPNGGSYTVGGYMRAFPLSRDHAPGTKAGADTDHTGMMAKLPAAGNRKKTGSGSGPYFYIRGHLLNDNLGGIANQANLFPITHEANGQHKSFVEEYIKSGIEEGYVYRYEVAIQNVKVHDETSYGGYSVDSDIVFSFARLDSSQKDVSGTEHKGKIQSIYETTGKDPFDKSTEYSKDYGKSYNHPKKVGKEDIYKVKEKSVLGSNSGLTSNVPNFSYLLPLGSNTLGSGSTQSINSAATLTPTGQTLSLRQSQAVNVINYFETLVTGWKKGDVTNWVNDVSSKKYTKWDQVFDSAVKTFNLEQPMVDEIRKKYLVRVSINGKAVGT